MDDPSCEASTTLERSSEIYNENLEDSKEEMG